MIRPKHYIKRKIIRNPNDNSGYMLLKPSEEGFHRIGSPRNKKSLCDYLINLMSRYRRGLVEGYTVVLSQELTSNGKKTFDSNKGDLEDLIKILNLKQRDIGVRS